MQLWSANFDLYEFLKRIKIRRNDQSKDSLNCDSKNMKLFGWFKQISYMEINNLITKLHNSIGQSSLLAQAELAILNCFSPPTRPGFKAKTEPEVLWWLPPPSFFTRLPSLPVLISLFGMFIYPKFFQADVQTDTISNWATLTTLTRNTILVAFLC